jgi:hypothetical protein
MRLRNALEAKTTRWKLGLLEEQYKAARERDIGNPTAKELTLFSLRRMINQMKEELICYECDVKAGRISETTEASA